jgi:hypothetical protein
VSLWRAARARRAARLAAGDPAGALAGWRFAARPEMLAAALAAVDEAAAAGALRPLPHRAWLAALPDERLPSLPADASLRLEALRLDAWARGAAPADAAGLRPGRWALHTLGELGEAAEEARRAWRAPPKRDPVADAELASLWPLWTAGGVGLWKARGAWERHLLGDAMGAFRQVLASRNLPYDRSRQALEDLREGLWFQLLGGGEAAPGWTELAARVLEGAGPAPLEALAGTLSPGGRAAAGVCLASRGHWPRTLDRLLPDVPGRRARGLRLAEAAGEDPGAAEALADLHAALRLVEGWREGGDLARDWQVIRQNRGRARGRLRALLTARPEALLAAIAGLDGLADRTRAAARRWAWDWAWGALSHGLELDFSRPISPPCRQLAEGLAPVGDGERPAAETWVLLAVLKGRLAHLRRWAREGGTGDHDGTWGRLLGAELPGCLRDPGGGYDRLRAWLSGDLEDTLEGWLPTLAAAAALPEGRGLKGRFEALLGPRWDPRVRFPSGGFPTFQRHAAEARDALEAERLPRSARGPAVPERAEEAP